MEEAAAFFARAEASEGEQDMQLQYDYLTCYIDFFLGAESNFAKAREVCSTRAHVRARVGARGEM